MTNKIFTSRNFTNAAFALCIGFFLNSCKPENPLDGIELAVNTDLIKNSYAIELEDAATGQPIASSVKISIDGPNKSLVLDDGGKAKTSFTTSAGFVSLNIQPGTNLSASNPVKFVIVAEAAGYITTSLPMDITSEEAKILKLTMVKMSTLPSELPQGVVAASNTTGLASSSGVTAAVISLNTSTDATTGTNASLEIPSGTKLVDKNGNVLNGALTTDLVYFNNKSEGSLKSFPGGGLSAKISKNGIEKTVVLDPAGMVSVEIKDPAGAKAQNFNSGTIKTSIKLAPGSTNPETGDPVQVGDSIPAWSFEPSTGVWISEGKGVVGANMVLTKDVKHLSYWYFGWTIETCVENTVINFTGLTGTGKRRFFVKLYHNNIFVKAGSGSASLSEPLIMKWLPVGSGYKITLADYANCQEDAIAEVPITCGGTSTVATSLLSSPVSLRVSGVCSGTIIKPSVWVSYKDLTSSCGTKRIRIVNGYAQADLIQGHNYMFTVSYNGKEYSRDAVINGTEFVYEGITMAEACK